MTTEPVPAPSFEMAGEYESWMWSPIYGVWCQILPEHALAPAQETVERWKTRPGCVVKVTREVVWLNDLATAQSACPCGGKHSGDCERVGDRLPT